MTALSKQDEVDLRASDLDPGAERLVREAWKKENRHPLVTASFYTVDIALSGIFVGSAYEAGLVPFAEFFVPFAWCFAVLYAFGGLFLMGMSKIEPTVEFHREDSIHLSRLFIKNWRGVHDSEYAVGIAIAVMLAISMAAAGYLWLSFAYASSFGIYNYGIKSLRNRTAEIVEKLSAAASE